MSPGYVLSICNALIDILVEVDNDEFSALGIEKGVMHLVDASTQHKLLSRFADHKLSYELGGSAMNTTRTLAALGIDTMFFGTVGKDDFGTKILSRMADLGITSRVELTSEPTGSCAILITPDGERTMNTCLGASSHYHDELVPHEDIRKASILHFTGYQWSTDHQRHAVKNAIKTAKEFGTKVSFDVADPFVVRAFGEDFRQTIIDSADIVFANAQEARDLYGCEPAEAAKIIADSGAVAVIKLGSKGALIRSGNDEYKIAPVTTTVVDTTAAGDMFAAGFLYGYIKQFPHEQSGAIAARLASEVISKIGAVLPTNAINQIKRS